MPFDAPPLREVIKDSRVEVHEVDGQYRVCVVTNVPFTSELMAERVAGRLEHALIAAGLDVELGF